METTIAKHSDIHELCNLLDSLFTQEKEFKVDREAQIHGLESIILNKDSGVILLARSNGKVIAMVNILYTISTALGGRVALLEDMVVAPTERDMGVGSKLLEYAMEFAFNNSCKRITLLSDENNAGAHRFYEKHGFNQSSMIVFRKLLAN